MTQNLHDPCDPPLEKLVADRTERHCREQLSALLDGALPADEARFLLRRLQHDGELAGQWERWQLYGDALRGSMPALLPLDFAQRVADALAVESAPQQAVAAPVARGGWMRWGGGMALAASVAVAALFVVQRTPPGTSPDTGPLEMAGTALPAEPIPSVAEPALAQRPADASQAGAAAAAAVALAVADAPRRAARRDRQPVRSVRAVEPSRRTPAAEAAARIVVASALPAAAAPAAATSDPFAGDGSLVARPWPRAVLPAMSGRSLSVGYGHVAALEEAPRVEQAFQPFEPQLPVPEEPPPPANVSP